jgi:hypothetical protein
MREVGREAAVHEPDRHVDCVRARPRRRGGPIRPEHGRPIACSAHAPGEHVRRPPAGERNMRAVSIVQAPPAIGGRPGDERRDPAISPRSPTAAGASDAGTRRGRRHEPIDPARMPRVRTRSTWYPPRLKASRGGVRRGTRVGVAFGDRFALIPRGIGDGVTASPLRAPPCDGRRSSIRDRCRRLWRASAASGRRHMVAEVRSPVHEHDAGARHPSARPDRPDARGPGQPPPVRDADPERFAWKMCTQVRLHGPVAGGTARRPMSHDGFDRPVGLRGVKPPRPRGR